MRAPGGGAKRLDTSRGRGQGPSTNRLARQAAGRAAGALWAVRWAGGVGHDLCSVQRLGAGLQRGEPLLPVTSSLGSRLSRQTLRPQSQSSQGGWFLPLWSATPQEPCHPCTPSTATPPFSSDWLLHQALGLLGRGGLYCKGLKGLREEIGV